MAHGDPQLSPWTATFYDYQHRAIQIIVTFNNSTRALLGAVLHRDSGCLYTRIALDNPNDAARVKWFTCPADGQPDITVTAAQLASRGLNTIEDVLAVQITAAP
jgi:hypothetical protein